jgi:nucleoside-diphosphate-sugar epimerase
VRVIVLGGTRFIGRAVVDELLSAGHEVLVVHRGEHEPDGLPPAEHLHADRATLSQHAADLAAFQPDAAVDISAMTGEQAEAGLAALPADLSLVAISSGDVYRAFASLHAGTDTDAVPLLEDAPVGESGNLGVEAAYLARGAAVLRLCAVYGEHDYQRRQDFVLRRVRASRRRMPIGAGTFLFSRCYVGDVARAVRLVTELAPGPEVFNVAERSTWSQRVLAERIVAAAGADLELVTVDSSTLPEDLEITGVTAQHLLMGAEKLRATGWTDRDPYEALRQTVTWDLANPPEGDDQGFDADEEALASAQ